MQSRTGGLSPIPRCRPGVAGVEMPYLDDLVPFAFLCAPAGIHPAGGEALIDT